MKKLRVILTLSLALCLVLALAACGGGDAPSAVPESTPESTPASVADEPASVADDSTADEPAADSADIQPIADALVSAAALGDDAIPMMDLDLKAGGVNLDDVAEFVGYQSKTYSDNGGLVIVIQAAAGKGEDVKAGLESFKESRMDDRYAEFATQVENTGNARIQANGDVVVMAVSATADWDALDAALADVAA